MARSAARRKRRLGLIAVLLGVVILGIAVTGSVLLKVQPQTVTDAVDWVRNIVGPQPVAAVESTYYRAADYFTRLTYQLTGKASTWTLAADLMPGAPTSNASRQVMPPGIQTPNPGGREPIVVRSAPLLGQATPRPGPAPQRAGRPFAVSVPARLEPVQPVVTATPEPLQPLTPIITNTILAGEGQWQPLQTLGQPADQPALLWTTIFRPDPSRPYAQVALVAMDLDRSQLHIVVGTTEPASSVPGGGLRTGAIPAEAQAGSKLLAAWNGGFKAIHGHYGMMTDGTVWLPPINGMATVAVDAEGRPHIGAWGRGVVTSTAWVAWRQNNPPLIEGGTVNPEVIKTANTIHWGAALDGTVFIWRSGLGLTPGRRWLIYAAGNALSVETLTRALSAAGASDAMQLDVNQTYERFVTFDDTPQTLNLGKQPVKLPITAHKLIAQMAGNTGQFLLPDDRDFFYLTLRG